MHKDWVCVHSSLNLQKLELLKSVLLSSGVDAVVLNKQDSFYPSIGEIELYVKRIDAIRARLIIDQSAL